MLKIISCSIILTLFQTLSASDITIKYHAPNASYVTMFWGVNDWQTIDHPPAGTVVKKYVMNTPLIKKGDDFFVTISLPDGSEIDYGFEFSVKSGPFKKSFRYLDMNMPQGNKFYNTSIKGNRIIEISPDILSLQTTTQISLLKYSGLFLFTFTILALFVAWKRFKLKINLWPEDPVALFFAISFTLVFILIIIRTIITGMALSFLIEPLKTLPLIFKTSVNDFFYAIILSAIFGISFLLLKNQRKLIVYIFGSFVLLSIIIAMANIKVISMLGRPFTYQWLYYSDFLKSSDASSAIKANLEIKMLASYVFMVLTAVPLIWLTYQLLIRKPFIAFSILAAGITLGLFAKNDSLTEGKKANPVLYFLSSLTPQNGLFISSKKEFDRNEFEKKEHKVDPAYNSKFMYSGIKNVIIYVLESTPAEYVTPFNNRFKTMPFLDSLKNSSALFDAFYAHVPSTNKSMVSILCGVYPYLSFKAITAEKPGIKWPSIPSELEKGGYRTSFINAGDNRFQGAENFLKKRNIDHIEDYRQGNCAQTYSDARYKEEHLDGSNDSCLAVKFLNWVGTDNSSPFFSMMWTYQTHYPYFHSGEKADYRTNDETLERYLNALHQADITLEKIVEGLKKRKLLESTLIVVIGDHGEAFGRHGQTTHASGIYEENVHIPLILINPTLFKGERFSKTGGLCDLAPTIFTILNKPIPEEWQGESLFNINRRNRVYFFSPFSDYLFGYRKNDYKFIFNATTNTYSLYDLKSDPSETINIADRHQEKIKETRKHIDNWIHYQEEYVNSFLKIPDN